MKKLLLILCLVLAPAAFTPGCTTAPSARVVQVKSLLTVGQEANDVLVLSAQLYNTSKITAAQARAVNTFYDGTFQPAFRLAVAAAKADLSSVASPDLLALAAQLATLIPALK